MSEILGRIAGFELVGLPSLPVWMAGAVAALLLVACVFAFSRAGRTDRIGVAARVALILVGAGAGFLALEAWSRLDLRNERRERHARAPELFMRAAAWPAGAKSPVVAATGAGGGEAQPPAASTPRSGLFFPSAASIPPVTIMNAEPQLPPETTGSTPQSAPPSAAPKQAPARRPAQPGGAPASGGNAQPARPPIDLNATSRTAPPAFAP